MLRYVLLPVILLSTGLCSPALARDCLELSRGIAAGEYILTEATHRVRCTPDQAALPLVYDRSVGNPKATQDLKAGTYLGPIKLVSSRVLASGDAVQLLFRKGAVTISREVKLLAPAREGQRALVRSGDGAVFLAPLQTSTGEQR